MGYNPDPVLLEQMEEARVKYERWLQIRKHSRGWVILLPTVEEQDEEGASYPTGSAA